MEIVLVFVVVRVVVVVFKVVDERTTEADADGWTSGTVGG